MNEIKSKLYYLISTGEILCITSECQGDVEETTREQDIATYSQLKDKKVEEVDYIELEYGTLETTFTNAKSYKANLQTKKLEVTYYTEEELGAQQKAQGQQDKAVQELDNRVSDITEYLQNQNSQKISDVEAYILESEKNKILN